MNQTTEHTESTEPAAWRSRWYSAATRGTVGAIAGTAFAAGAEVGWDAASKKAVAAGASGSAKFGHAVADADAADGAVFVRLQQGLN